MCDERSRIKNLTSESAEQQPDKHVLIQTRAGSCFVLLSTMQAQDTRAPLFIGGIAGVPSGSAYLSEQIIMVYDLPKTTRDLCLPQFHVMPAHSGPKKGDPHNNSFSANLLGNKNYMLSVCDFSYR